MRKAWRGWMTIIRQEHKGVGGLEISPGLSRSVPVSVVTLAAGETDLKT